jgi:hypothetical protein
MPDIQMDYDLMEEMVRLFRTGAEQFQDTMTLLSAIAAEFRAGALLGEGGDLMAEIIGEDFVRKVRQLHDKLEELNQDVWGALVDVRDGDHTAYSRFKD